MKKTELNEERLEEIARQELLKLDFYNDKQPLYVVKDHDGIYWLNYQSAGPFMHHQSEGVSFTLAIADEMGALNYLFVNEHQRKKGYGRQTIKAAEEIFKQAGCTYAEAKADKEFSPFLTSLGYKEENGFYRRRF